MKFVTESKFLSHTDLSDTEDTVVTIKANSKELIGRGVDAQEKYVLHFKEFKKGLVLNKTNGKLLARLFDTEEMDTWTNRKIALYVKDDVEFQGEVVSAIRVRPTLPGAPKTAVPFSVGEFMTEVNLASSSEQLWKFVRDLAATPCSEEDRTSLHKLIFRRMDEFKERSTPNPAA